MIYDMANLFQLTSLVGVCCGYIDKHATEIMKHDSFLTLSPVRVYEIQVLSIKT